MAHPTRSIQAYSLLDMLADMPFKSSLITWDIGLGEWETGFRCIKQGIEDKGDWHIILQDDAIISRNLYTNVVNAIQNIPSKGILSLYTGQVKPHRGSIQMAHNRASSLGASYLSSNALYWGVCVVMPTLQLKDIVGALKGRTELYDTRIGLACNEIGLKVYYTNPSLVNHDDELDSLIGHSVNERRIAHRYEPSVIKNWNSFSIKIF